MKINLNQVISSVPTAEGVTVITAGSLLCAQARNNLRNLLKDTDPEGYAEYRKIKYPDGRGSETHETCVAATRFIFARAGELLAPHYVQLEAE
jgi:hypothetical protein